MITHKFLVVIETQRVKDYLFASPVLRETRGASLLLDELNRQDTERILKQCSGFKKIYLGGGSGRILFEERSVAQNFANQIRSQYQHKTFNARVSVEVVPRDDNESIPAWMARGVGESQKNKLGRIDAIPIIAGRWLRPCSSCGQLIAETDKSIIYYDNGRDAEPTDTHYLCASCYSKRDSIRRFYRHIKRNKGRYDPISRSKLRREHPNHVLTTLVNQMQSYNTLLPQDLDQIGEESVPRNYIGFIYADGNRMGEIIKSMAGKYPDDDDALEAYHAFSQIVDESTREAAAQAVYECVGYRDEKTRKQRPGRFIPAEFVLAGGDDLILIVPAQYAIDVTCRFIALFNQYTREKQEQLCAAQKLSQCFEPDGLTISAGIVIAHASYPASQLMELAGDLMKLAKRKAADLARTAKPAGTLDFMVLHSSGSESMKLRRKREYTKTLDSGLKVELTERPYTVTEAKTLLDRIRALKKSSVPRNKLKQLYPVLFQDILPAQFNAQRIRERLEKTGDLGGASPMKTLVDELNCFPFRVDPQQPKHWTTNLTEIIELYDFVQDVQQLTGEQDD